MGRSDASSNRHECHSSLGSTSIASKPYVSDHWRLKDSPLGFGGFRRQGKPVAGHRAQKRRHRGPCRCGRPATSYHSSLIDGAEHTEAFSLFSMLASDPTSSHCCGVMCSAGNFGSSIDGPLGRLYALQLSCTDKNGLYFSPAANCALQGVRLVLLHVRRLTVR